VLVATLILGTAIVAVIQSFSVGLKARAVGAEYEPAVSLGCWIAETRFLQVPLEQPLGMDKGYQWSWKATPIKREGEKDDENAKKVMQALSCEVRWSSGNHERLFKIHTLEVHRK
jgi:hypothetical protein